MVGYMTDRPVPALVRLTDDLLSASEPARLAKVPYAVMCNWMKRGLLTAFTDARRAEPGNDRSEWRLSLLDAIILPVMHDLSLRCGFPLVCAEKVALQVATYALARRRDRARCGMDTADRN